MRNIFFLFIPSIILFSSAKIGSPECGDVNFCRVSLDDMACINYCLSDSFKILKKEVIHDTISQWHKGQFISFEMFSTDSNSNQIVYFILKDKANGNIFQSQLSFSSCSPYSATCCSNQISLKKLHNISVHTSDFSLSVLKIENEGKDTLRCELGDIHVNYNQRKNSKDLK